MPKARITATHREGYNHRHGNGWLFTLACGESIEGEFDAATIAQAEVSGRCTVAPLADEPPAPEPETESTKPAASPSTKPARAPRRKARKRADEDA